MLARIDWADLTNFVPIFSALAMLLTKKSDSTSVLGAMSGIRRSEPSGTGPQIPGFNRILIILLRWLGLMEIVIFEMMNC